MLLEFSPLKPLNQQPSFALMIIGCLLRLVVIESGAV